MSAPVALALAAWAFLDLFLLLSLAGCAATMDGPGNKLWACSGILAVFLGVNAIALDSAGKHFGF